MCVCVCVDGDIVTQDDELTGLNGEEDEGEGWDVDDELELPADLVCHYITPVTFISLSLSLSLCLSCYLFISVYPSICLSVCLSVSPLHSITILGCKCSNRR